MSIYDEYPEFRRLSPGDMAKLIRDARLSPQDEHIATERFLFRRFQSDIAADEEVDDGAHGRSFISYRLRRVIVPHLLSLLRANLHNSA